MDSLATSLAKYDDRSTLLFTGHSAGAATASLLYAHALSVAPSRLASVAKTFTDIHCILFGCPPVTVHPLQHYGREDDRLTRSFFLSFLNAGDPIIKADPQYILAKLRWPMSAPPDARSPRQDCQGKDTVLFTNFAAKASKRLFVHSGRVFSLTLDIESPCVTLIKEVDNDELDKEAAMSWQEHRINVYRTRIESCEPGHGDASTSFGGQYDWGNRADDIRPKTRVTPWLFMILP
jgi:hypothetical protein